MSEALDYLLKARPEAMGAYFAFMKEAGRHLDPKTRALISVITKVDGQTEAGFRQYLTRALQAGASANEVLDALLMAFPTLGLAKVVWAIDLLLDMNMPEFRLDALAAATAWHDLGAVEDTPDGATRRVDCDGRELFLRRRGGDLSVYDSRCPHQDTNIPEGGLDGDRLRCPRHGWVFDLATGDCVAGGDRPLRRLPARIEGGRILARW